MLSSSTFRLKYLPSQPQPCRFLQSLHYNIGAAMTSLGNRNFSPLLQYYSLEPLLYMLSVLNQNIIVQCITVLHLKILNIHTDILH